LTPGFASAGRRVHGWAIDLRPAVLALEQAAAPFHALRRCITWRGDVGFGLEVLRLLTFLSFW